MKNDYKFTYVSTQGKEYPVKIIRDNGYQVDLEFDPAIENLTILSVARWRVKELDIRSSDVHYLGAGND